MLYRCNVYMFHIEEYVEVQPRVGVHGVVEQQPLLCIFKVYILRLSYTFDVTRIVLRSSLEYVCMSTLLSHDAV